jgi:hypothetical protein
MGTYIYINSKTEVVCVIPLFMCGKQNVSVTMGKEEEAEDA